MIGTEDFSLEGAKEVRDRLAELKIAYEFELIQGPEHNIYKLYDHSGLEGLRFHVRYFGDSSDGRFYFLMFAPRLVIWAMRI